MPSNCVCVCVCVRCAHATGLIDQLGMRIRMVSKLRKHDAAIMELGLEYSDKMAIPPGVLGFPLSGYCIAECTQTVIYDSLHIFLSRNSMITVFNRFSFWLCYTWHVCSDGFSLSHGRHCQNLVSPYSGHNCIHIFVGFEF